MTATLTRRVFFKRKAAGALHMNAEATKSIPFRKRTVTGAIHFSGRAAIAAVGAVKRGLNKLGFSIRID
jgi:hypothetical protein